MKQVFWLAGGNMNKFHAFYEFSSRSVCLQWMREGTISQGIALGLKWNRKSNKKNQKCKECLKALADITQKEST